MNMILLHAFPNVVNILFNTFLVTSNVSFSPEAITCICKYKYNSLT